jgi:hypothetical protein
MVFYFKLQAVCIHLIFNFILRCSLSETGRTCSLSSRLFIACYFLPIDGPEPPCRFVMGLLPQKGATQRERQDRFLIPAYDNLKPYSMLPAENYQPSAEQIKKALLPNGEELDAIDELIATGEAVFHLVNVSEMDEQIKNAIYRLEKHFNFYARLVAGSE